MSNQERLSWLHENHYDSRGQRGASYVVTNGDVEESTTATTYDIWDPALTHDVTGTLTQGTTLIGIANVDNAVPVTGINIGVNATYGSTPRNRPIIIDEIGARVQLSTSTNFYNWQLQTNLLWIDQATWVLADFDGTCTQYAASNYLTGSVSNAWRRKWAPDRLYSASVGVPDQNVSPTEHGPNALVIYADANGETCGLDAVRPLSPLITDSQAVPGCWRPPKNSIILDPGQAVILNVYELFVQQAGFQGDGSPISAAGTVRIAAWIRFRQPSMNETDSVTNEEITANYPTY